LTLGFSPRERFIEVSITGQSCELSCPMCGGRWLRGMRPAPSPKELAEVLRSAFSSGARGALISGGFDRTGRLRLEGFLNAIREMKREFDPVLSVHPGLVGEEEAEALAHAGFDIADVEVIPGSSLLARGLPVTHEDYLRSLEILMERGPRFVAPHILVGAPSPSGSPGT